MKVRLTELTTSPISAIERAASNCYDSDPNGAGGRIMRSCYNSGHHSVLEFADFTFHLEGVSRALTHQLVRHRTASYAQRSQRYCFEDGFEYVVPESIENNIDAFNAYTECMTTIKNTYRILADLGVPNEDARYVLPNACTSVIELKVNGRELIHICNERLCARAQWEIRDMVKLMVQAVREYNDECAEFSKLLVPKCYARTDMPFCTEHQSCGKAPKLSDVYNAYKSIQPKTEPLILLVGKSGSGKTTIAQKLVNDGYVMVQSYTTRKPRHTGEDGHTFISEEKFNALKNIVSYTYFNGHHYGVTSEMLDKSSVFVVDPAGVHALMDRYKTSRRVVVFYLDTSTDVNMERMRMRGDTETMIEDRVAHDNAFDWLDELKNVACQYEFYIIQGNYGEDAVYEDVKSYL